MTDLAEKVIDAIHAAKQKRGATKEEVANAAIVAVLEGIPAICRVLANRASDIDGDLSELVNAADLVSQTLIAQHRGQG